MCEDGSAATLCIAQVYFGPTVPAYVWDGLRVTTAHGNRVALLTEASRAPADVDVALHPIDRYSGGEKLRAFRSRYVRMGRQEPYEQRCGERWFALLSFLRAFGEPAALYLDSDVVMLTSAASVLPPVQTPDCDSALCLQPSNPGMAYETVDWTVSPHNALVSVRVLEEYTDYVLECARRESIRPPHPTFPESMRCVRESAHSRSVAPWRDQAPPAALRVT